MKTIITTIIAAAVLTAGSVSFSKAAVNTSTAVETTLANIGRISKIEVHGNVEVNLANGAKDQVTVNNNYYAESALVQDQDGMLRITNYKAEKLVVYVTVNDLRSIAAYDNSIVKTDGLFQAISLEVNLYNNAYAGLKLDNYAANITVNDRAKADLAGSVTEYYLTYSSSSTVNRTELVATNASETKVSPFVAPKHKHHQAEEMAGM